VIVSRDGQVSSSGAVFAKTGHRVREVELWTHTHTFIVLSHLVPSFIRFFLGKTVRLKESQLIESRNETANCTRVVVARLLVMHICTTQRAAMCSEWPNGLGDIRVAGGEGGGGTVGLCCRPSTRCSEWQRAETTVACTLAV
jgi:hypothetical protein